MFTDCFRGDLPCGCEHREFSILGIMLEIKPAVLSMHTEGFCYRVSPTTNFTRILRALPGKNAGVLKHPVDLIPDGQEPTQKPSTGM